MSKEYGFEYNIFFKGEKTSSTLQIDAISACTKNGNRFSDSAILDSSILEEFQIESYTALLSNMASVRDIISKMYKRALRQGVSFSSYITIKKNIRIFDNGAENRYSENVLRLFTMNEGLGELRDVPLTEKTFQNYGIIEDAFNEIMASAMQLKQKKLPENKKTCKSIILSPQACAYFIHEIIGHLLELDYFDSSNSIFSKAQIGKKLFGQDINVVDDPFLLSTKGINFGEFDDDGNPIIRKQVIENGTLIDAICSKRVDTLRNPPLYRMFNLYLEANPSGPSLNDMIASVDEGIYAGGAAAGNVNGYSGTFCLYLRNCRLIKSGKLAENLSDFALICSIQKVMERIELIGNGLQLFPSQCRKSGQTVTVGTGGVPILIASDGLWG